MMQALSHRRWEQQQQRPSGTSTPSTADSADKLVATLNLKEANDIERERFENDLEETKNLLNLEHLLPGSAQDPRVEQMNPRGTLRG